MKRYALLLSLCLLSIAATADAAVEYPKPTAWVNDYAGVLSSSEEIKLNGILQDFEATDSTQVFVAIMNRIPDGASVEEYANTLFEKWQIGQKSKDNGVLLFVAVQDRKLRIEVGYGLEDRLTDAQSKLIIANEITPSFKANRYGAGITNGVNAIIAACRGAYKGKGKPAPSQTVGVIDWLIRNWLPILIVLIILNNMFNNRRGRRGWSSRRRSNFPIIVPFPRTGGWGGSSGRRSGGFSGGFGGFSGGGGGRSGGGGASGSW